MWGTYWRDQRRDWTKAGMALGPIFATVWLAISALFPISVQARALWTRQLLLLSNHFPLFQCDSCLRRANA